MSVFFWFHCLASERMSGGAVESSGRERVVGKGVDVMAVTGSSHDLRCSRRRKRGRRKKRKKRWAVEGTMNHGRRYEREIPIPFFQARNRGRRVICWPWRSPSSSASRRGTTSKYSIRHRKSKSAHQKTSPPGGDLAWASPSCAGWF